MTDATPALVPESKMRLTLDGLEAKIVNVNPRMQKHGPDDVLAADVIIEFEASRGLVAHLCNGDLGLWHTGTNELAKGAVVLKSSHEFKGLRVELSDVVGDPFCTLTEATFGAFTIDPQPHASADCRGRLQALVSEDLSGKLSGRMKKTVFISTVLENVEQQDLAEGDGDGEQNAA